MLPKITEDCQIVSKIRYKYAEDSSVIQDHRGLSNIMKYGKAEDSSVIQDHRGLSKIILDQIWKGQRTVKDYYYCYYPRSKRTVKYYPRSDIERQKTFKYYPRSQRTVKCYSR